MPQATRAEFLKYEAAVHATLTRAPHENVLPVSAVVSVPAASAADAAARATQETAWAMAPVPSRVRGGLALVQPKVDMDLHTYIRKRGRLPLAEARALFGQLVAAVAHCHSLGIVLRDLKLGKVFFADETHERIVLGDLEGAQLMPTPEDSMLLAEHRAASAYVSPESLDDLPHDPAAVDMWALGVIFNVLLTGSYPFQDDVYVGGEQRAQ